MNTRHVLGLTLIFTAVLGCGRTEEQSETKIVGGAPVTDLKAFPWIVSIQNDRVGHFCGGTLVAPKVVLTAAHCVKPQMHDKVRIGAVDLNDPAQGEEIKVVGEKIHEGYSESTLLNDLAILILEKPATKAPLKLNDSEDIPAVNDSADVIGWGVLKEKDILTPPILHQVALPVRDAKDCVQDFIAMEDKLKEEYGQDFEVEQMIVNESHICAGPKEGGKDSCQGDSGGPLFSKVANGRMNLTGIVSYGFGCARENLSGLYTRVSYFQDWINDRLSENK
ncbi:MAG: trypsin-like serine protease [Oligoflexales bacterium]